MSDMSEYVEDLYKGHKKTLKDDTSKVNAKVYIQAADDLKLIQVDRGIIKDETKKCDFIAWGVNSGKTHFIELKGDNIERAYEQIGQTIDYMQDNSEYKGWEKDWKQLDSYIASPSRQRVPRQHCPNETKLAKKLAKYSKEKPEDIYELIFYVKVVGKQKSLTRNGQSLLSSSEAPVELG